MKPAPFTYDRPDTLAQALLALGEGGRPIAGGQSLVPLMSFRTERPDRLVDVAGLAELRGIRPWDAGGLVIGACTTQAELQRAPLVAERCPILVEAVRHIAHPPIRARGTIGGSLAHAMPTAELPAVALLLDAELAVLGPGGERTIAASDFFCGAHRTALAAGELLTEIRLPGRAGGWGFAEVARRQGDPAVVGAAAHVEIRHGLVEEARLVLFAVSDRPLRARAAEALAVGARAGDELWGRMADAAIEGLRPPGDLHATSAYRRHTARLLARRVLAAAGEGGT